MSGIVILSGAEVARSETSAESKDPYPHRGQRVPHFSRPLREVGFLLTTNDQRPTTLFLPGDAFKFFMVAYLSFRLLCDFIKPYPSIFLGLGGIQWACLLTLLYYSRDIALWLQLTTNKREKAI